MTIGATLQRTLEALASARQRLILVTEARNSMGRNGDSPVYLSYFDGGGSDSRHNWSKIDVPRDVATRYLHDEQVRLGDEVARLERLISSAERELTGTTDNDFSEGVDSLGGQIAGLGA